MTARSHQRQDHKPTKRGYMKGCFGSPTLGARRKAAQEREKQYGRAHRYATRYIGRRSKASPAFLERMKDKRELQRETDRITRRQLKKIKGTVESHPQRKEIEKERR